MYVYLLRLHSGEIRETCLAVHVSLTPFNLYEGVYDYVGRYYCQQKDNYVKSKPAIAREAHVDGTPA